MSEIPPPTVPPSSPPPPGGGYAPPPPPPPPPGGAPSSDRTVMLILSYLGLLSLIPFLVKKDDAEVQWHAKNGLVLCGAEIVLWIVFRILISFFIRTGIGCVVGIGLAAINCVVALGLLVLHILLIMKAINGQRVRLPVLTDLAEKL